MYLNKYILSEHEHITQKELKQAKKQGIDIELMGKYLPTMQRIYSFPNGYGASVITGIFDIFSDSKQLELAVIKFNDNPPKAPKKKRLNKKYMKRYDYGHRLIYNTPITDNIERFDNWDQVYPVLENIFKLSPEFNIVQFKKAD